jgi:hypothetical protein
MNPLFLLLIVGGIYLATKGKREKRAYLKTLSTEALWQEALRKAMDSEIEDMYTLHTKYKTGVEVPPGDFRDRLIAISNKYNIYT